MPGPVRLMVFEGYAPGYGFFNHFGALSRPLLRRGAKGPAVVEAQKKLMEILQRNFRSGADGDFGPETETAVREVQAQFGLTVDGVIGNDTWTLLLGEAVAVGGTVPNPPTGTVPVVPGLRRPIDPGRPVMPVSPPEDISISGKSDGGSGKMWLLGGLAVAGVVAALLYRRNGGRPKQMSGYKSQKSEQKYALNARQYKLFHVMYDHHQRVLDAYDANDQVKLSKLLDRERQQIDKAAEIGLWRALGLSRPDMGLLTDRFQLQQVSKKSL